jgi:ABC-type transport system involved in multi-copper enzyme maturation permease subunit
MNSYLKYILKSHRGFLIFALVFVPLIQFLLIDVFTGLETKPFLDSIMKMMPPQFKMIIGDQFFSSLSVEGAAGFGLNHPVVLTLLIVLITGITSKHIAGAIENGTMEMLLSLPVRRTTLILRLWLISALILVVVVVFALIGLYTGVVIYDHINAQFIDKVLRIGINLFFLMLVFMSFSLMISSFMKESGRASSLSAIVILILYFADILSSLWKPLEFFKPFNIFFYYQPQKLITGQRSLMDNLPVLFSLSLIFLLISLWKFRKRDI